MMKDQQNKVKIMQLTTMKDYFNFATMIIIFTLAIYHLFIYLGRIDFNTEKYNLYFSLVGFACVLYIFFDTLLINKQIGYTFAPICAGLITFFAILVIRAVFPTLPATANIIYNVILIGIIPLSVIAFPTLWKGLEWNKKFVMLPVNIGLGGLGIIAIIITVVYCSILRLWTNNIANLIVIGLIIYGVNSASSALIEAFDIKPLKFFEYNYLLTGIFFFIVAIALSNKFNNEYKELKELKKKLESKVQQRTEELQSANKELEKVNAEKTNIFINLAHEIKTPLTLINIYLDKHIDKPGKRKIQIVRTNFNKLCRDIVNFFDILKYDKGQSIYNHDQVVDVSRAVNEKIDLFRVLAVDKKIHLRFDVDPGLYTSIDPAALDRIINNLLENAIKYTGEDGEVVLTITGDDDKILFSIRDTGPGIYPEQREHIFKPYYQLSHKKSNNQGIGLGLSIVRMIIEQINGDIKIISDPDQQPGATFILTFTRSHETGNVVKDYNYTFDTTITGNNEPVADIVQDGDKRNILVVEDVPDMQRALQDILSPYYNIYSALNGKEALKKLLTIPIPTLIISDIMMDKMDGFKFREKLLKIKDGKYRTIPFIFLTARMEPEDKIKGLEMNAVDYITKPFHPAELLLKVTNTIKNHEQAKNTMFHDIKTAINQNKTIPQPGLSAILKVDMKQDHGITGTEQKIIELLRDGCVYKEIADIQNKSLGTIKNQISKIYKKLKVNNKEQLIDKTDKYFL